MFDRKSSLYSLRDLTLLIISPTLAGSTLRTESFRLSVQILLYRKYAIFLKKKINSFYTPNTTRVTSKCQFSGVFKTDVSRGI